MSGCCSTAPAQVRHAYCCLAGVDVCSLQRLTLNTAAPVHQTQTHGGTTHATAATQHNCMTCFTIPLAHLSVCSVVSTQHVLHTVCVCCVAAGTADRIVQEGFDMRLTTVAAYGNGIYFAGRVLWT